MPEISLTDFVDFTIKAGPAQFTKVKEIFGRGPYDPRFDFWKPLREGIQDHHQLGKSLDSLLSGLKDQKKLNRYPDALKSYKKYIHKNKPGSFKPPSGIWSYGALKVRVNPELGFKIEDKKYAVKIYFKDETPTKQRLNLVFEVMRVSLVEVEPAVLDLSSSRLITPKSGGENLQPFLEAQALSFLHMWKSLREES
jgi:hypothetical protein